jgi:hypothetical protein
MGVILDIQDTSIPSCIEKLAPFATRIDLAAIRKVSPVLSSIITDPDSIHQFSYEEKALALRVLVPHLRVIAPADWDEMRSYAPYQSARAPQASRRKQSERAYVLNQARRDTYQALLGFQEEGVRNAIMSADTERIAALWPSILLKFAFISQVTRDESVARLLSSLYSLAQAAHPREETPFLRTSVEEALRRSLEEARLDNWYLQALKKTRKVHVVSASIHERMPFRAVRLAEAFKGTKNNVLVILNDDITRENVESYLLGLNEAAESCLGKKIDLRTVYPDYTKNIITHADLMEKLPEVSDEPLSDKNIIQVVNAIVQGRFPEIETADIVHIGGERILIGDMLGVLLGILDGDAAAAEVAIDLLGQKLPKEFSLQLYIQRVESIKDRFEKHTTKIKDYYRYVEEVKTRL